MVFQFCPEQEFVALKSPGWRAGALISPPRAEGPYTTLRVGS